MAIATLNLTFNNGQTVIDAAMLSAFQQKINELVVAVNSGNTGGGTGGGNTGGTTPVSVDFTNASVRYVGNGTTLVLVNIASPTPELFRIIGTLHDTDKKWGIIGYNKAGYENIINNYSRDINNATSSATHNENNTANRLINFIWATHEQEVKVNASSLGSGSTISDIGGFVIAFTTDAGNKKYTIEELNQINLDLELVNTSLRNASEDSGIADNTPSATTITANAVRYVGNETTIILFEKDSSNLSTYQINALMNDSDKKIGVFTYNQAGFDALKSFSKDMNSATATSTHTSNNTANRLSVNAWANPGTKITARPNDLQNSATVSDVAGFALAINPVNGFVKYSVDELNASDMALDITGFHILK